MPFTLHFENHTIEKIDLEREINFIVSNPAGYVCRLVPGEAGLELSDLDKSIENVPDINFLIRLSDFIVRNDA